MSDTKRPGGPIVHDLKTWPEFFSAIADGSKPFEVRKADRDFVVGDILCLREWEPVTKTYSGRAVAMRVTYILTGGQMGVETGRVVMGLANALAETAP